MAGISNSVSMFPVQSVAEMEKQTREAAERKQQEPVMQSLAGHVRKRWSEARDARSDIEERMADGLRRRRGEYDARKLAEIREYGGSEIFLGITSVKCRAAAAWLRETLMGTGVDRPWQLDQTPLPDLPPEVYQEMQQLLAQQLMQAYQSGQPVDPNQVAQQMRDQMMAKLQEESKDRVQRMADKIEDQLVEGGWLSALSEFIDDITTFPTAILKGPVVRRRKQMRWGPEGLQPVEDLHLEWERVDPFMAYPAPWASCVDDGYFIERHRMTREDLQALLGVEGYDEDAIRSVLLDFDGGNLREWLAVDSDKADAEGKDHEAHRPSELIDAIQLWDSVQGSLLIEWGIPEEEIEDPVKSYPAEVWLIGDTVIRAVLNYDPLGRKPYYATSYEKVPGAFWGNSVVDLVADPQDLANAAARALANNMGIASGPQVDVNISRLPPDEDITSMHPWKIWQTTYSDFTDARPAINFFQPNSNAQELLGVMKEFTSLADEYSGIPKYMTGEHVAGAGRTSSGLSMLINNAAKSLKHVVSNVDYDVINPMLERIYQHNLRYSADPDMVGDVRVVARGAMSLVSREAAAVRRNEFLQIVLGSPVAQQIVGLPGVAELLRENARLLDVNSDRLVPSREELEGRMQQMQQLQAQAAALENLKTRGEAADNFADAGISPNPAMQQPSQSAPTQPDGSRVGGRDTNFQSPRPNMR